MNVEERIAAAEAVDPQTWVLYLDESMYSPEVKAWIPVKALASGGYEEQGLGLADASFEEARAWVQQRNEQRGFTKKQADIVVLASFRRGH